MSQETKQDPAVPRSLEDIKKEYADLLLKVGQAQYQREVFDREVKTLNDRLYAVNTEAAKRNQLDAEAAKVAPTEEAASV